MVSHALLQEELAPAIIRRPLTIAPTALVGEAIAMMSAGSVACNFSCELDAEIHPTLAPARQSCVLVLEGDRLVGVVTERDFVRLHAQGHYLNHHLNRLTVGEVMTTPVLTLREGEFTDLFVPLKVFQEHHIRHLPLVDDRGAVVGLLTRDGLRRLLRPTDLLRVRTAAEVMTRAVVTASPQVTLTELVSLMSHHRVSSVAVVAAGSTPGKSQPVGIVTERDVVQMLALELDFTTTLTQTVMSAPVFTVPSTATLWSVRSLMQERQINQVPVVDRAGDLLGMLSQTDLLSVLNSAEIYRLLETLEQKVSRLEAENLALLQVRNAALERELERQVALRTEEMRLQVERERLLTTIASQIRASLNLSDVLETAVTLLRGFFQCDRVLIYQFEPDWSGIVIAESAGTGWVSSLGNRVEDSGLQARIADFYDSKHAVSVQNIYAAGYETCHIELLERYQVRALLVVPIHVSEHLWGLAIAHQCREVRDWLPSEREQLTETAIHLAIAIQNANAHAQLAAELQERKSIEDSLRASEQFLRSIYEGVEQAVFTVDVLANGEFRFVGFNPAAERIVGKLTAEIRGQVPGEKVRKRYAECLQAGAPITYEECLSFRDRPTWWMTTLNPVRDAASRIYRIIGTSINIDERKQAESLLEIQNGLLERIAKAHPLSEILDELILSMESQMERSLCSVMVCEGTETLRSFSGPNLPQSYLQACDGIPIGEGVGSCGTAAFRRQPAIVADIATDPLWQDFKEIALAYDLRACWSFPIFAGDATLLGTFGVYHREVCAPQAKELAVVAIAANIAGIAIERDRSARALRESNQELERRVEARTAELSASNLRYMSLAAAAPVAIFRFDPSGNCVYVNDRWSEMTGRPKESALGMGWVAALHPDDRDRILHECRSKRTNVVNGSPSSHLLTMEGRHLLPDGTINWFYSQSVAEVNADGEVTGYVGTLTDITKRKETEIAFAESQQFIRQIADASPHILYLFDVRQRQIVYVNHQLQHLLAYSVTGIQAMDASLLAGLVHPEDRARLHSNLRQIEILSDGEIWEIEFRVCHANGDWHWLHCRNSVFRRDADDKPEMLVGTAEDISDRKQLEQTKNRLLAILESSTDYIGMADARGNILWHNTAFKKLDGPDGIALAARAISEYHPAWAVKQILEEAIPAAIATGSWMGETMLLDLEGREIPVSKLLLAHKSSNGEVEFFSTIMRDMRFFKQAEEALRQSQARLEEAHRVGRLGNWEYDAVTRQISCSEQMLRIFGLEDSASPLAFEDFLSSIHPDDRAYVNSQDTFSQCQRQGYFHTFEHRVVRPDGSIAHVEVRGEARCDAQGQHSKLFGTVLDITERKQYEQQLERSNAELLRAKQLKDEFLATMSHELRTPLNAILGMSEGLKDNIFGEINDRQRRAISTIESSGRHLLELINDILEVSKIEAGKLELTIAPVAIAELCNSSLVFIRQQAFQKNIQLDAEISTRVREVHADERRLRQVLINLLNNAVKFTPEGGRVMLEVREEIWNQPLANSSPDNFWIVFAITDTGIGIAAADLQKLFQPFTQIDSKLNRQYAGTGLGLTLVKRIVELHGGRVSVESELGRGSCFTIYLPQFARSADATRTVGDPASPAVLATAEMTRHPLILLAEDNEPNISSVTAYLEAKGYRLLVARNGNEAVAIAAESLPDFVLMDIQMPGIDGLEAIQRIRRIEHLGDTPIIAMTALAMPGDRDRCLAVGANAYLAKPVKLSELVATIEKLAPRFGS